MSSELTGWVASTMRIFGDNWRRFWQAGDSHSWQCQSLNSNPGKITILIHRDLFGKERHILYIGSLPTIVDLCERTVYIFGWRNFFTDGKHLNYKECCPILFCCTSGWTCDVCCTWCRPIKTTTFYTSRTPASVWPRMISSGILAQLPSLVRASSWQKLARRVHNRKPVTLSDSLVLDSTRHSLVSISSSFPLCMCFIAHLLLAVNLCRMVEFDHRVFVMCTGFMCISS